MLLDFHLAREPLAPDASAWFGGTARHTSPEQRRALDALAGRRPVAVPVDGRSDLYSLGVLLYEALGGETGACPSGVGLPPSALDAPHRPPLHRCNPQVSVGLSDVIRKCLAVDPGERYPGAGRLAADLRRHLADQALRGVGNRSWAERWRKWRRRRPHALAASGLLLLTVATALVLALVAWNQVRREHDEAEADLLDGRARRPRCTATWPPSTWPGRTRRPPWPTWTKPCATSRTTRKPGPCATG
jgi:hypothetical protein